ncbi:MAG: serine hydrolase domain-containing protein [Pseudomonadota bacterium]
MIFRRLAFACVGALALVAVGVHFFVPPFLKAGTGITAKQVCSLTFVSGFTPDEAWELYLEPILQPFTPILSYHVDDASREVTAAAFGFGWKSRAIYRDGIGCTLVHGRGAGFDRSARVPSRGAPVPMAIDEEYLDQNFDRAALNAAVDAAFANRSASTLAVVVLHDGQLVAERYAPGISEETPLHGWSMTKSAAATMAGVLSLRGELDVFAAGAVPPLVQAGRPDISVNDLLRMQAGLAIDERNDGFDPNSDMLFTEADMPAFAAMRKKVAEPGAVWDYQSGQTNLAGTAYREVLGSDVVAEVEAVRDLLFEPLGIRTAVLEPDQAGNFVWSSYMYASARDWARLGQLYVAGGVAPDGTRLIPEHWPVYVAEPTAQSGGNYGAGFWLTGLSEDAIVMDGFQGQSTYILPKERLVIVRLAAEAGWSGTARDLARSVVAAYRETAEE